MSEAEIQINLTRLDLARTILNADSDIVLKVSEYMKKLCADDNYYESPEFYADLETARKEIAEGKYVSVKSEDDLTRMFL